MREIKNEAALIKLLNSKMSYALFKEDRTLLTLVELPFLTDYNLVKAKTFATIPSVEFGFLWNERECDAIKIDGERSTFFDNVNKLKPIINSKTAFDYVKFVFGNVWDENGAFRLCQSIADVEFSATPTEQQRALLSRSIKPAVVAEQQYKIVIECNIIYGTALYAAKIELYKSGFFEIVDEKQIGEEIAALRKIFLE